METSYDRRFFVQFWGVRGSVPVPGKETVRYGGNTSCIQMQVAGKCLIFDAGTGIQNLGKHLAKQGARELYLFFTHYHWDHIQGFPFFTPAFQTGNCLHIHGAVPKDNISMEQHFIDRVLHPNSPVPLNGLMQADMKFYEFPCGTKNTFDGIEIETGALNHPNGAMGYRVTWQGKSVFYCTDTEHFSDRLDENVLHLAQDADVFIYDAMYTDEEYHNPKSPRIGWGHSTWQEAVKLAKAANVGQLVIFHHEPTHSDEFLDEIEAKTKDAFPNALLAREGLRLPII